MRCNFSENGVLYTNCIVYKLDLLGLYRMNPAPNTNNYEIYYIYGSTVQSNITSKLLVYPSHHYIIWVVDYIAFYPLDINMQLYFILNPLNFLRNAFYNS